MRKKWLLILLIPIAFIAIQCGYTFFRPSIHKQRLLTACENANRLVVDLNVFPESWDRPQLPTYEVTGSEKIKELLEAIEFEHSWTSFHCKCYGEMFLTFYHDNELLTKIGFQHGQTFRSHDKLWYDDIELTPETRKHVSTWLKSNGCPDCDEADSIYASACETKKDS